MRRILRVGAGLALVGVIAVVGAGEHAQPVRAQMAVEIDMVNNQFGPHDATVAAGGTPFSGGVHAATRFTPATFAVSTLICAEATMG